MSVVFTLKSMDPNALRYHSAQTRICGFQTAQTVAEIPQVGESRVLKGSGERKNSVLSMGDVDTQHSMRWIRGFKSAPSGDPIVDMELLERNVKEGGGVTSGGISRWGSAEAVHKLTKQQQNKGSKSTGCHTVLDSILVEDIHGVGMIPGADGGASGGVLF